MKTRPLLVSAAVLLLGLSCRSAGTATQPAAAAEDAESYSNTVKWSTASEVDNFGYDVYRGEGPDGPFVRLTQEPVEGAGTSDEVHRYRFVDETINPKKTYYYYVESISMSGVRERFTPVGKAKAKIPQEGESDDGDGLDQGDGPDEGES